MTDAQPSEATRAQGTVSRYPGVHPFSDEDADRDLFHGRDLEKYELLQLVLAERLVVVFSRSGLGKSSLINAGVMAPLRKSGYFPMVARITGDDASPVNALYHGVAKELERQSNLVDYQPQIEAWNRASFWHFFKSLEIWRGAKLQPPILILDQFEELFTLHNEEDRIAFIRELAGLVRGVRPRNVQDTSGTKFSETPPDVKVVLVLREEFYPNLEELRTQIPGVYRAPFRLAPLTPEQARNAIEKPAMAEGEQYLTPPFHWDDSAIDLALGFLSGQQDEQEKLGHANEIEPFQLQLICLYAEGLVQERGLTTLTAADLGGEKALQSIIGNFYEDALTKVCREFDDQPDLRNRLEVLCENGFLIKETGRRRLLEESDIRAKFNVDREVLRKMLELRLIREEPRVGDSYYELAHDTLVDPIQRDRKLREERNLRAKQDREAKAKYEAARKKTRRWTAISALSLIALFAAGIAWNFQQQSVAKEEARAREIAAAEAARAREDEIRVDAAIAEAEAAKALLAAEQAKRRAEEAKRIEAQLKVEAEKDRLKAENERKAAEEAKAKAEARLAEQAEREADYAAARDAITRMREDALNKIAGQSADAHRRANESRNELLALQNAKTNAAVNLAAAKEQLETAQSGDKKDAEELVTRLEERSKSAAMQLADFNASQEQQGNRTAGAAIDRVHEDLRIRLDQVLKSMSNVSFKADDFVPAAVYIEDAEQLVQEAGTQVIDLTTSREKSFLAASKQPTQDTSPAAQATFELSKMALMEEDEKVSDAQLSSAYQKLRDAFSEALSPAENALVEDKILVFSNSAETFESLTSDLFICEELDALSVYAPPRSIGPERNYVEERSAELQQLGRETAIVVTAENLINTDRKFGTKVVETVRLGQKAHMQTWVTSPKSVSLDLRLVTPDGEIQLFGRDKRRVSVKANPLSGPHVGYRLYWPATIRQDYEPGDYEWQLRDSDDRPLCRTKFKVE